MGYRTVLRLMGVLVLAAGAWNANALLQGPVPDLELAKSSVVVIGYWPKATLTPREFVWDHTLWKSEVHTEFVVTKVIHGSLSTGRQPVVLGSELWWDKDGRTSTLVHFGEDVIRVPDASRPALWFLERGRSWARTDPTTYLVAKRPSCLQPINLLPLFEALRGPDRNSAIGSCLESRDPEVVERALDFVSDGWPGWPLLTYDRNQEFLKYHDKPNRIGQQLPRLRNLIRSSPEPRRGEATALYIEMKGKSSEPLVRSLIDDPDPRIRLIAAAYLVRFRSKGAEKIVAQVFRKPDDEFELRSEILREAGRCKDSKYVPLLIDHLQDCDSEASPQADADIPALWAQSSLKKLTGFCFPHNVSASLKAWNKAKRSSNPKATLVRLLGAWESPIVATVCQAADKRGKLVRGGDEDYVIGEVTITNRSRQAVVLLRRPWDVEITTPHMQEGGSDSERDFPPIYVTIAPGASIAFRMNLNKDVFASPDTSLTFGFYDPNPTCPAGEWMGDLPVAIARKPKS